MAADATGIREYKGAAKATTTVAGITNASTSFSIADSTGWPTGSVGNFVATLEQGLSTEERILCSALAGGVLTVVTRGYDNTTAVAHAAGSSVSHSISAVDIAEGNYIANFRSVTTKATPADADVFPLNDVAGGNVLKNLTWANVKATLLTYFNSVAQILTNKTLTSPNETTSIVAAAPTATQNIDALTAQDWLFTTNAANNFAPNIRGDGSTTLNILMAVGQTKTFALRVTNGATPYYLTALTIDGTGQTLKWANGAAPTAGNASAQDVYSIAVTKTATNTYTVIASLTKFA